MALNEPTCRISVLQIYSCIVKRVGRNYIKADADQSAPKPTSDLGIAKKALDAAVEREQFVSISDPVNAFPKSNDRFTYA